MLQNLDWTKATVNGKKAALVVYDDNVWLLSYTVAWDSPTDPMYENVPAHGFFKKMIISTNTDFNSFSAWRDDFISCEAGDGFTIALPGEAGFERNIQRRRRNTNTAVPNPPAQVEIETPASQNDGSIDFYLPRYTTVNVYRGQNPYHNSHQIGRLNQPRVEFTGHRIGVELEVEANTSVAHRDVINKTSNWFTRETDRSLGSYGIEFITIPLLPCDAKSYDTWNPLVNYLKTKAKSWNTGRCGLHVHIGREILGATETEKQMTLGKLLIFYQSEIEKWNKSTSVFGRESCYHQPDGDTDEIKAVKCLGKSVLKDPDVYEKVDRSVKERFSTSRYYAVNLTNTHTIEFRKGRGSINADRIIAVITFVESICLFCRATEPQDLTLDNFMAWLRRNLAADSPLMRYISDVQPDA